MTTDYEFFTETLSHSVFGWEEGEAAHRLAQYMQQSMPAERAQAHWHAFEQLDLDTLLPEIQAPTLVMHRREFALVGLDVARRLAARIPDARLKIFDGRSLSPYMGEVRSTVDAITDFIGVERDTSKPRRPHAHRSAQQAQLAAIGGFRTIMFTDMEGSTALTQRLGDEEAQERVRVHDQIVRDSVTSAGGVVVKHTGDGIMASFLTASAAVESAIEIQREFARHNELSPDEQVAVRIGINAGEPVMEGDDLFGTAVQLASRVCNSAEPGEIMTSDVVRQLVAGKGFLFSDRGDANLRGFEDPVRVYDVRWREEP
jgi:class 3 adenylate cyclase